MKKRFCFYFMFILGISAVQSQALNHWIDDPKSEDTMLVGPGDREGLQQSSFQQYFLEEYNFYSPDDSICDLLQKDIEDLQITIVLGTWCSDSREQVPRFYKILDQVGFNGNNVTLVGVDRNKHGGEKDISGLYIEFVPTFMFFKDGREIGRIVETPEVSLEQDWFRIMKQF